MYSSNPASSDLASSDLASSDRSQTEDNFLDQSSTESSPQSPTEFSAQSPTEFSAQFPTPSSNPDQPNSPQWQWRTWRGIPYLTCTLLDSWSHGFFTQQAWPQLPGTLTEALTHPAQVYRVKQVHGNGVLLTDGLEPTRPALEQTATFAPADGLVSTAPQQAVWVCSADCTPALIGDVRTGQVSAIHAGWRGTAARIVPEAIAKLLAQGSQLPDLRVALGPAIAGAVYPVGEDVAAQTGRSLLAGSERSDSMDDPKVLADAEVLDYLWALPQSPILPDPEPGKVKLDVRQVNVLQMTQLGLSPEQISVAPYCTYQTPEQFFSYRRTGQKQVQWSGIVSRPG